MDENSIRDDVTKNNCEKNVDQNQFRENNFHKIFWDGSINVIFEARMKQSLEKLKIHGGKYRNPSPT